jgi:hypothetical protein
MLPPLEGGFSLTAISFTWNKRKGLPARYGDTANLLRLSNFQNSIAL